MSNNINGKEEEYPVINPNMAIGIGALGALIPSMGIKIGGVAINSIPMLIGTSALPITLGIGVCASGYGIYRVCTKDKREYRKMIEEERSTWEYFFEGLGIKNKKNEYPILVNKWDTDYGHIFSFINAVGLSSKDFESKDIAIKEFTCSEDVEFETIDNFINIKTIETKLPQVVPFILPKRTSDELIVELGVNKKGKKMKINFNKIHSWLIAGATGSGKSVCTHNILSQLYCNYSDICEFYIVDMKKVELINYKNLKSTVEYIDEVKEVEPIIDKLLKECDDRHRLFIDYGVKNLSQYNKKVSKKDRLPNIVLCVEECVRLMSDNKLQAKIAELAFIARSAGIIIIMTIQRATKNLFSPDIKASLLGKIGFQTVNRINSQVIMDDNRLFEIKERGECAISSEDISLGEQNVKVMYLEEHRIDRLLRENCEFKK